MSLFSFHSSPLGLSGTPNHIPLDVRTPWRLEERRCTWSTGLSTHLDPWASGQSTGPARIAMVNLTMRQIRGDSTAPQSKKKKIYHGAGILSTGYIYSRTQRVPQDKRSKGMDPHSYACQAGWLISLESLCLNPLPADRQVCYKN